MAIREEASLSPQVPALPRSLDRKAARAESGLVDALDRHLKVIYSKTALIADWIEDRTVTITSSYTVDNETVIIADATSGAIIVTLPPALQAINRHVTVKKSDSTANTVTIQAHAAELIDDANTKVLTTQFLTLAVVGDGTQWWSTASVFPAGAPGGLGGTPVLVDLQGNLEGVSLNAARSDHRHKLDETIAPDWTNQHDWRPSSDLVPLRLFARTGQTQPYVQMFDTDGTTVRTIADSAFKWGFNDPTPTARTNIKATVVAQAEGDIAALSPYLWLKASDLALSNGATITGTWLDKTPNGRNISGDPIGGVLPYYWTAAGGDGGPLNLPNSRPVVSTTRKPSEGPGGNKLWDSFVGSPHNFTDYTIYIVVPKGAGSSFTDSETNIIGEKRVSLGAGMRLQIPRIGGFVNPGIQYGDPTLNINNLERWNNGVDNNEPPHYPDSASWHRVTLTRTGGVSELYLGDLQQTGRVVEGTPSGQSLRLTTLARYSTGSGSGSTALYIAEIIVFMGYHGAATRNVVWSYLDTRYHDGTNYVGTLQSGVTLDLLHGKDASGAVLTNLDSANKLSLGWTGPGTARTEVRATAATEVPLILRGAASQTADLLQLHNSSAVVLNRMDTASRVGFRETTTPAHVANEGKVYTKDFGGRTELCYFDSDGAATGVEVRLTTLGAVSGIGPGTVNRIAKFTSATAVGNSSITDTGALISSATPADWDANHRWLTGRNIEIRSTEPATEGIFLNQLANVTGNGDSPWMRLRTADAGTFYDWRMIGRQNASGADPVGNPAFSKIAFEQDDGVGGWVTPGYFEIYDSGLLRVASAFTSGGAGFTHTSSASTGFSWANTNGAISQAFSFTGSANTIITMNNGGLVNFHHGINLLNSAGNDSVFSSEVTDGAGKHAFDLQSTVSFSEGLTDRSYFRVRKPSGDMFKIYPDNAIQIGPTLSTGGLINAASPMPLSISSGLNLALSFTGVGASMAGLANSTAAAKFVGRSSTDVLNTRTFGIAAECNHTWRNELLRGYAGAFVVSPAVNGGAFTVAEAGGILVTGIAGSPIGTHTYTEYNGIKILNPRLINTDPIVGTAYGLNIAQQSGTNITTANSIFLAQSTAGYKALVFRDQNAWIGSSASGTLDLNGSTLNMVGPITRGGWAAVIENAGFY